MTTAFGVARDSDGQGTDPLTLRRIIQGLWENTGVASGLDVTGSSGLAYSVSAGMAVCSMADSDGYTEAYWPGGSTENTVDAGDQTYPRIDSVYMLANTGTPDNRVHVMVAQGTPGSTPVAPSLPVGALRLMDMLLPAGASSTQSASGNGTKKAAIPYGASLHRIGWTVNTADYVVPEDTLNGRMVWHRHLAVDFAVPTDRCVRIEFEASSTVGASTDITKVREGSYFAQVRVDGTVVNETVPLLGAVDGNCWEIVSNRYGEQKSRSLETNVTAGAHHAEIWVCGNNASYTYPVTLKGWRFLRVRDMGIAQ